MICKQCGRDNEESAKFCGGCGTPLTAPAPAAAPAPVEASAPASAPAPAPKGKKKLLILAAAVAVAVILAVGVWMIVGSSGGQARADIYPKTYQGIKYDDGYAAVVDGTVLLQSDSDIHVTNNVDGSAAAYRTQDGLFLAGSEGITQIAVTSEECEDVSVACDGAAVAYMIEKTLYHYDAETKNTSRIAEGVRWHVLSPYGRYVAYATEDGLYRWNGKSEKLDDNEGLYNNNRNSISDEGLIYLSVTHGESWPYEYDLYCFDEQGNRTLIHEYWNDGVALYNRLQTQIIFPAYDDSGCSLYFSEHGKPAVKLLSDTGESIGLGLAMAVFGEWRKYFELDCPVDDFRGQIICAPVWTDEGEDGLVYLDHELNARIILGYSLFNGTAFYERAYDNSYVYVWDRSEQDALYSIDVVNGKMKKLMEDVIWFSAAGDGVVYFSDEDLDLYCLEGRTQKLIANGIDRYDYMGTASGNVLYVNEEGDLWFATRDGASQKVDTQVDELWRDGSRFYYRRQGGGLEDVYFSADGETFTALKGAN